MREQRVISKYLEILFSTSYPKPYKENLSSEHRRKKPIDLQFILLIVIRKSTALSFRPTVYSKYLPYQEFLSSK